MRLKGHTRNSSMTSLLLSVTAVMPAEAQKILTHCTIHRTSEHPSANCISSQKPEKSKSAGSSKNQMNHQQ
jgi:hypothetical protein